MKKIEITTSIQNGKIKRNAKTVIDAFKSFEGKNVTLILKPFKNTRSIPQNAYYWGVVIPIWQNIIKTEWVEFYSKEEIHEFLKYNCNYIEKVNTDTGECIRLSKSTTQNSTTEQEEFHLKARQLAFDMFSVNIPLPNEQTNLNIEL
ncbi:MAG TPA: hypothetical protein DCG75_08055 [Bacteroidales bacterium]|nr:hypothetical protein [Bacteroidales bacterium]